MWAFKLVVLPELIVWMHVATVQIPGTQKLAEKAAKWLLSQPPSAENTQLLAKFTNLDASLTTTNRLVLTTLQAVDTLNDCDEHKKLFKRLKYLQDIWAQAKVAENEKEQATQKSIFLNDVMIGPPTILSLLAQLDSIIRTDPYFVDRFKLKDPRLIGEPDDLQSLCWKFQKFMTDMAEVQRYGYVMYLFAYFMTTVNATKAREECTTMTRIWKKQAGSLQFVTGKQMHDTDSRFNPPTTNQQVIKAKVISGMSSFCRAHYFRVLPEGAPSYGLHSNLRIECYETPKDHPSYESDDPNSAKPTGRYVTGRATRWISTDRLSVFNATEQFICRLYFYESLVTHVPTLRLEADFCSVNDITDVKHVVPNLGSVAVVTWPYKVLVNNQMPKKWGYVTGIQLQTQNDHVMIQYYTSYRAMHPTPLLTTTDLCESVQE